MMNAMRKHTKTILWFVVAAFVSTIFFVWGMDAGKRQEFTEKQSAAVVNDIPISYEAFGRLWEQRFRQIYQDSQEEPAPQEIARLREDLIDDMIEGVLLQQLFEQHQLDVYPQEIAARIASVPAFKENNQFSQQKYLTMLQYNRITPAEFEAEQKEAIALIKASQIIKDSIVLTEQDLKDYFLVRNRKIKLAMVIFDWKNKLAKIKISENQLKTYYEDNTSRFETPEEVNASHILIKVDAGASDEDKAAAKLKLEDIRNKIIDGEDFAKLAKEHSDDPGSKTKGGNLGFFRRGMMVPPFENTAFSLNKSELSSIVETDFGYHIIKVIAKKEAKKSSFKEVRKEILSELKEAEAKKIAQTQALDFSKLLNASQDLIATAKLKSTKVQSTKWLQEGNSIKGLSSSDNIMDKALDLGHHQTSTALFDEENIVFVQVMQERYQPFNETVYNLEKDSLLDKLKTIRGNQARQDWIKQAKADATIINNIAKEREEQDSATDNPSSKTTAPPVK